MKSNQAWRRCCECGRFMSYEELTTAKAYSEWDSNGPHDTPDYAHRVCPTKEYNPTQIRIGG